MTYKQVVCKYSKKIAHATSSSQKEIINYLAFISKTDNTNILKNYDDEIEDKNIIKKIKKFAQKRAKHFPYEYITKEVFFYEYNFCIKKGVLIPRSESEILLGLAVDIIKKHDLNNAIDMCCGSGILGICLKKQIKHLNTTLSDISKKAIKLSVKNACNLQVGDDVKIIKSDLFDGIDESISFDICISNPPYIKDDYALPKNVQYEPKLALFGGNDGCDIIFALIKQCQKRNIRFLLCEIGYDQKELVNDFVKDISHKSISFYKDYSGFDRGFILEF